MRRWAKLGLVGILLAGILLAATPVHAAALNQSSVIHVVGWGETLFSIARHYDTSVEALCAANGITNPAHIYAGQRLVIPSATSANINAPAVPATAGATHVVDPGENLYRIALRYGTTVQALAQLNGITNHHHVVAGQALRIPGGSTAPAPAYQPAHTAATHTVQAGETLAAIAMRYGITTWTLAQANSIANPALIFRGQVLVIPRTSSTAPAPALAPAAGSGGGKRIVVDLSEQHLYAYQGGALIYSFVASTGMAGAGTRTGTFRVLDQIPNAYASTWSLQMPYWLGIYWAGATENGIHALPILSNGQQLWAGYLGTPVSYGCIVLGTYEARLLYEWAEVGTPVVIQR